VAAAASKCILWWRFRPL